MFDFAAPSREVAINVAETGAEPWLLWHRINKPGKQALIDHQNAQTTETLAAGSNAQEVRNTNDDADANLWAVVCTHVKEYDFKDGTAFDQWHEVNDDNRELVPYNHRAAAIVSYYQGQAIYLPEVDELPDVDEAADVEGEAKRPRRGFIVSAAPMHFRLLIGPKDRPDYEVDFWLRRTEEKARKQFTKDKFKLIVMGQGRAARSHRKLFYQAYVDYLVSLVENVGSTGHVHAQPFSVVKNNPKRREEWLKQIDPLFAMELVHSYQDAYKAGVRD